MALKETGKLLFNGYGLVLGFAALIAGLVVVHGGSVLNVAFPTLATALACYLYLWHRNVYIAFVWWMWLFAPLVRRLADYQTAYHSISPIIATPLIVTSICVLPLLANPGFLFKRSLTPFLLVTIAYGFALLDGFLAGNVTPALYECAGCFSPMAFALMIMRDRKGFAENRNAFMFASNLGLLLIAAYGLYQFFQIPPWDAYWIKASNFNSAGQAVADKIRLFGTLNSPGPYGDVLMLSLAYVLVTKGPLRLIAGGVGFPAFGLSLVRASWLGWAAATIFLVVFSSGKTRIRLLRLGIVLALIAYPTVTVGPVADALSKRFATFTALQNDHSYQDRQALYEYTTADAFSDPIGAGFGGNGIGTKLGGTTVKGFDSGFLQIPFEFGWVFGALFVWGMLSIGWRAILASRKTSDSIVTASAGLYIALVLENSGAPTWDGVYGMTFWIAAAFALGPIAAFAPGKIDLGVPLGDRRLVVPRILHGN